MFVFDCTAIIGYDDYMNFVTSVKKNFDAKKAALFDKYHIADGISTSVTEEYFDFRNRYRSLRQDVIRIVLDRFRRFLPNQCLIYEFGSLTKLTDRIESDTDLTICYDANKTDVFECTEELINYTIVTVFEHTIDHIHGKFQHYPINHTYDDLTEEDNLYVLKFDRGCIEYSCGAETLSENIMSIKNVRDYRSLIDGYREKYELRCNIDCLYSILILENTTNHDFLDDLAALEAENDIFDRFRYDEAAYAFDEMVEISYIKKALKNTIVSMYIMIAYLRKRIPWREQYSMTMDDVFCSAALKELFGASYIAELRNSFITMLFYWDKIELLLKRNDISLSTRCHRWFARQELNDMLYRMYQIPDLMGATERSINTLNKTVSEGWRMIRQNYGKDKFDSNPYHR